MRRSKTNSGVEHVDLIAADWNRYVDHVAETKPERVFEHHEMTQPDGGWYAVLYALDNA